MSDRYENAMKPGLIIIENRQWEHLNSEPVGQWLKDGKYQNVDVIS
jgi:hypothetical protein